MPEDPQDYEPCLACDVDEALLAEGKGLRHGTHGEGDRVEAYWGASRRRKWG